MIGENRYVDMMFKNLRQFEQNIGVLVNNSNESESKLRFPFSFIEVANILGFLTNLSIEGNEREIIEILTVIADSTKFNEKKYQDLFMKVLEYFEDEEFRLLCS